MDEEEGVDLEAIEKEIRSKQDENTYLRNRNLGLQDSVESNFLPKQDTNVIEFKLSPEELLERIEHYLRGDVLKSRTDDSGQLETYYSIPTKKITVTLFENIKSKIIYIIDEHPKEDSNDEEVYKNWEILGIIEGEGGEVQELMIEDNYKNFLLEELKKGLKGRKKKLI